MASERAHRERRSEGAASHAKAINSRPSKKSGAFDMMENHHQALDRAQQHLSKLLIADVPDHPAICEAADAVRRLERQAAAAERGRHILGVPK